MNFFRPGEVILAAPKRALLDEADIAAVGSTLIRVEARFISVIPDDWVAVLTEEQARALHEALDARFSRGQKPVRPEVETRPCERFGCVVRIEVGRSHLGPCVVPGDVEPTDSPEELAWRDHPVMLPGSPMWHSIAAYAAAGVRLSSWARTHCGMEGGVVARGPGQTPTCHDCFAKRDGAR